MFEAEYFSCSSVRSVNDRTLELDQISLFPKYLKSSSTPGVFTQGFGGKGFLKMKLWGAENPYWSEI